MYSFVWAESKNFKESTSPTECPIIILRKESGIDFGILPKGERIPPSRPSTRTLDNPPPPPHAPFVILIKKESKINFGMYLRNNLIPPSSPSGQVPLWVPHQSRFSSQSPSIKSSYYCLWRYFKSPSFNLTNMKNRSLQVYEKRIYCERQL